MMTRLTRHLQLGWRFVETTFVPVRRIQRRVYKQNDRELTSLIRWMVLQHLRALSCSFPS